MKEHVFSYEVYSSAEELKREDALLLNQARSALGDAYAPYSHFRVAAAARLANGQILTGTNQENASFPRHEDLRPERTLLSARLFRIYPGSSH